MKKLFYLFLLLSHTIFSQQIPFKITGTYEDGLIKKVNVHRNPTFTIDTIIINKDKFVLTGKLDYPRHINIGFNDFEGARGVYTDGNTINVKYKNTPNLIDSKVIEVSPISISGNPITIDDHKIWGLISQKFSDNFSFKDKAKIMNLIEKHREKYPNSLSSLALISNILDIASTDEINALMEKIPIENQDKYLGPSIKQSLKKRSLIGMAIKNYSFPDINGVEKPIIDTTKQYTFIMFWDAACGPCRIFNRKMNDIIKTIDLDKVAIIGVSLDSNKLTWKKAIKEDKVTWTQLNIKEGFDSEIIKTLNFNALPYDLLVDKNLVIRANGYDKSFEILSKVN
ncbi:thioredoxin-like domain-containing protein [Flectobacillus roseus]|uniref:thioredoxin-like domain-containing protein n=1 Tax=Flectobacillus roseus TaxID=502259 RepID=UPI0024B769DB|nr:thioredoxin-like domain-containing protein [Flectobacillus roseus]MDI9871918.1 thioredoxin-like domain-containing protein [Flectobacillus roseus]